MKEILISGYYGFHNSGDDALLQSIVNDLEKYGLKKNITVLSANPSETSERYGVNAINRMNVAAVIYHMKKAALLISGGGTLLQDGTSTKPLLYYITIIKTAQHFGVKTMLYSNGIGPLSKEKNRKLTAKTLEKVDFITLRDETSERLLHDIGVKHNRIKLTADPVFNLESENEEKGKQILSEAGVPENVKILGISVREWGTLKSDFFENVAKAADYAADKYGLYPVIIPMQANIDNAAGQKLSSQMESKHTVLNRDIEPEKFLAVIANMDICIGMRLHTLIYAAAAGVPIIGLVYDPKVSGFMDYAHQKLYTDVCDLTYEGLKELIDECMSDYGRIKSELSELKKTLKELSKLNCKYAAELARKGTVTIEEKQ